ncbi:hypothetical protein K432DRAFT_447952 [Lepidopterella palustris CBS 459.81]|uniref:Uncharacterized protein n=1 Tax=Lepidopterella palustris CBS 459.81 TaxID=1314670 RepID=A0A8E2J8B1_9PEZI|nr:hypothetical protein K432DRAFT_447952 [Lepidopterella palustris CBS 459.81]
MSAEQRVKQAAQQAAQQALLAAYKKAREDCTLPDFLTSHSSHSHPKRAIFLLLLSRHAKANRNRRLPRPSKRHSSLRDLLRDVHLRNHLPVAVQPKSYLPGHTKQQYHNRYSAWHAVKDVANVWDIVSGVWFRYKIIAAFPFGKKPTPHVKLPEARTLKVWDTRYDRSASIVEDSFGSEVRGKASSQGTSESEKPKPVMAGGIQEV